MIERGLYYATPDFAQMIRLVGGSWNDTKHRPLVCLVKSNENEHLYWAIPIRSCYYHIGRTTSQSIFFISDAIPMIDRYIDEIHVGGNGQHYIIKNRKLIQELERKLFRILSIENSKKNHFRQHITDVKHHLLNELGESTSEMKSDSEATPELRSCRKISGYNS